MYYPRILVVSNNSFSKTGSNGRTLGSFFYGWPKNKVAQFCISTDEPDYDVCDNYYLVTDKSAFDGFVHFRKASRCNIEDNLNSKGASKISSNKVVNKSPITVLIRNIVWQPRRWESKDFKKWVDVFAPEVILLTNSDSIFILNVALVLSRERKIPLVMFNTEGFYFFKKPFINSKRYERLFFNLYQYIYRRAYAKLMKNVDFTIYSNQKLQHDYEKVFGGENLVLYTGSAITLSPPLNFNENKPVFSYIGNLAYCRIDALMEVAEVLQSINTNYVLNVYGRFSNVIQEKTKKCKGLRLKGFISYDKMIEAIKSSDVLFHAEVQDDLWAEALKYGFSTKIADSVSSGKCFVIYSSPDIAGADYIIKTGAGWFAQNKEELKNVIMTIINDKIERKHVLSQARKTALKNHQKQTNSEIFQKVITNVINR